MVHIEILRSGRANFVFSNIRVSADRRKRAGLAWCATLALISSLVVALVLPLTAAAGFSDPTVVEVPNTGFAISDAYMECNEGPSDLTDSSTCPVLQWNGYTYWPMSFDDNRFAFALVAPRRIVASSITSSW